MGQSRLVCKSSKLSLSCDLKGSLSASTELCSRAEGLSPITHEKLKDMEEGDVVVESLGLYMSPMEKKSVLTHHFLILDVQVRTRTKRWAGFIRAEKQKKVRTEEGVEDGREKGIITLDWLDSFDAEGILTKYTCQLEGCEKIPMKKLTEVLLEHEYEYSVGTKNCWKYADKTYRRLIEEISNLPGTRSETKQNLQSHLEGLPALRLPSQAICLNDLWNVAIAAFTLESPHALISLYRSAVAAVAPTMPATVSLPALDLGPVPLYSYITVKSNRPFSASEFHLITRAGPAFLKALPKVGRHFHKVGVRLTRNAMGLRDGFLLAARNPQFWVNMGIALAVIFAVLLFICFCYKIYRCLKENNFPYTNFLESIGFMWTVSAQWIRSGFKGLFEWICSWFTPKPVTDKIV